MKSFRSGRFIFQLFLFTGYESIQGYTGSLPLGVIYTDDTGPVNPGIGRMHDHYFDLIINTF